MSGVYIPGMKMPNRGHTVTLIITGGGEAVVQYYDCKPQLTVPIVYKAILIPDHGRLGDLDALKDRATKRLYASNHGSMAEAYFSALIDLIDSAPTVIQADKEEADV